MALEKKVKSSTLKDSYNFFSKWFRDRNYTIVSESYQERGNETRFELEAIKNGSTYIEARVYLYRRKER